MDPRPVGVFDSGTGGLTVLHECLVTMPHEDFLYLGDLARLPYGPRPLGEIRRFAGEIAGYLEGQGVKLVVAACNAATSAALPELTSVEPVAEIHVAGRARRPIDFHRFRSKRGLAQPDRRGSFWRLHFADPVRGPLGFGCHFGLGLFAATGSKQRRRR